MGKRVLGKAGSYLFLVGLLTLTMGFAFFQQVGSGMVGFWRCEQVASPSLDTSGTAPPNDGAWSAGVTSLPGPANTPAALGTNSTACLSFNGTTGVVTVPHTAGVTLPGDFTVALWVYKQADATDWVRIIGKGTSGVRTFGVWEEPNAAARILFQQYGPANLNFYSTGTIPLTTWTHLACRISGNNATIFINGANSGATTRSGASATDTDPLTLGYAGFHTYWNGRMDDVRLYNRALLDAEIAALATGSQGPPAPSGLTATAGNNQVALAWSASGATVFNVKRSTVSGGPYTTIASNVAAMSFTDPGVVNGTTYYYVVTGVSYGEGANSNEASATPLPVTALPNTGLQTNEGGATTSFNITFNSPAPAGGSVVTVSSNNLGEGTVSVGIPTTPFAGGFQFTVPAGTSPVIPVTVTGVNDLIVDGPRPYTVTVTASGFGAMTIPGVQLTNNDNDIPGITFSRVSGLGTDENGGTDTFSVTLNTQPFGFIDLPLSSSNTLEMIVSPASLRFTPSGNPTYSAATGVGDYNVAHVVTVTGVDDAVLDFTIPFTVITGTLQPSNASDSPAYNIDPPDVTGVNIDNEVIPTLPAVWGGGGGGGCGLIGLELAPFLLLGFWRRRRSA